MKIRYEAFDGTLFDEKCDCEFYEHKNFINMYDCSGKKVDDVAGAAFVHINHEDGAEWFTTACEKAGELSAGISLGDMGWFYWDEFSDQYHYMPTDILEVFAKIACKED